MERETIHVWITKYALTKGIFELDVDPPDEKFPGMICDKENPLCTFHGEGSEWHRTKTSAMVHAEKMRLNKIKSLKKQIEKLESLVFITGGDK